MRLPGRCGWAGVVRVVSALTGAGFPAGAEGGRASLRWRGTGREPGESDPPRRGATADSPGRFRMRFTNGREKHEKSGGMVPKT